MSAITHIPMMFLPSNLLCEYQIELVAMELPCIVFTFPARLSCRGDPCFVTGCPCGVWDRGLTTSLAFSLYVATFVSQSHDDVIKWKHFPRYWPFVRGIHRSPVNSPHKGQWRGALMFTLICARINGWVNNREAGDFRRYRAHYDVIVMYSK